MRRRGGTETASRRGPSGRSLTLGVSATRCFAAAYYTPMHFLQIVEPVRESHLRRLSHSSLRDRRLALKSSVWCTRRMRGGWSSWACRPAPATCRGASSTAARTSPASTSARRGTWSSRVPGMPHVSSATVHLLGGVWFKYPSGRWICSSDLLWPLNPALDPASCPMTTSQARCTRGAARRRRAARSSCRTGTAWRAARAWCCAYSATTSRTPSSSAQARLRPGLTCRLKCCVIDTADGGMSSPLD